MTFGIGEWETEEERRKREAHKFRLTADTIVQSAQQTAQEARERVAAAQRMAAASEFRKMAHSGMKLRKQAEVFRARALDTINSAMERETARITEGIPDWARDEPAAQRLMDVRRARGTGHIYSPSDPRIRPEVIEAQRARLGEVEQAMPPLSPRERIMKQIAGDRWRAINRAEVARMLNESGISMSEDERKRLMELPAERVRNAIAEGNIGLPEVDIGSPHYGAAGAPLPGVVGKVPGFRTLPEAAATIGTMGLGTVGTSLAQRAAFAVATQAGSSAGEYAAPEIARPLVPDEYAGYAAIPGAVVGGLGGGLAGIRTAQAAERALASGARAYTDPAAQGAMMRAGLDVFEAAPPGAVSEPYIAGHVAERAPTRVQFEPQASRAGMIDTPAGVRPHPDRTDRIAGLIEEAEQAIHESGKIAQLPGVRHLLQAGDPAVGMARRVLVAASTRQKTVAELMTDFKMRRAPVLQALREEWRASSPKYIGDPNLRIARLAEENPEIALADWLQRPSAYAPASPRLQALRDEVNEISNEILDRMKTDFNIDVAPYRPTEEGAIYIPHMKAADTIEDIPGQLPQSIKTSPRGGRVWDTLAERMEYDPKFTPEADIATLFAMHDAEFATAAGGKAFKVASGGLTRGEVVELVSPRVAAARETAEKMVDSLTGRINTAWESFRQAGYASDRIEALIRNAEARVEKIAEKASFLDDAGKFGPEYERLVMQARKLEVQLEALRMAAAAPGRRKLVAQEALVSLNKELSQAKQRLASLRQQYKSVDTSPYVRNSKTNLWHTAEESQAIDKITRTELGPLMSTLVNVSDEVRSWTYGVDVGPLTAIQYPLGWLADPIETMRRIPAFVATLKNPLGAWRQIWDNERDLVLAYARARGRPIGQFGPETALMPQRGIGRTSGGRKFIEHMMAGLEVQQYYLWKHSRDILIRGGKSVQEAEAEAANYLSKAIPALNPIETGRSAARAAEERWPVVSTSFIAAPPLMLKDVGSGVVKLALSGGNWSSLAGREQLALRWFAFFMGSIETMAISSHVASGYSLEESVRMTTDPSNGRHFMSVALGKERTVPLGGPFRSAFRAFAPQEFGGQPHVPFGGVPRYITYKLLPHFTTPLELAKNRDFYGRDIMKGDTPEKIARGIWYGLESMMPLPVGAVSEAVRTGESLGRAAETTAMQALGMDVRHPSEWDRFRTLWKEKTGTEWNFGSEQYARVRLDPELQEHLERAQAESRERNRPGALAAQKLEEAQIQIEQDTRLPEMAQLVKDGVPEAGSKFMEAYARYRQQLVGMLVLHLFGREEREPQSEDARLLREYQSIQLEYDEEGNPLWGPYLEAEEAAFDRLPPYLQEYIKTRLFTHDPVVQEVEKQLIEAKRILREAPPKYEGLDREDSRLVNEFFGEVSRTRAQVMEVLGYEVKASNVAMVLAEVTDRPGILEFYRQAQDNPDAVISEAYTEYLKSNKEILQEFYPDLYDSAGELKRMGIIEESPYVRPRPPGRPSPPDRETVIRDSAEQAAIRRVLLEMLGEDDGR